MEAPAQTSPCRRLPQSGRVVACMALFRSGPDLDGGQRDNFKKMPIVGKTLILLSHNF